MAWTPPTGVIPLDRRNIRTANEADLQAVLAWLTTKYSGAVADGVFITGNDTLNTYYVRHVSGGPFQMERMLKQRDYDALSGRISTLESAPGSGATPEEFDYTSGPLTIAPGATVDIPVTIPTNRLYGLFVGMNNLSGSQTTFVQMFGDAAKTEIQYSANFTVAQPNDTSQAWRYRSRAKDNVMHLSIKNTSSTAISTATITIKVEPF
jgi:hypothetical protein